MQDENDERMPDPQDGPALFAYGVEMLRRARMEDDLSGEDLEADQRDEDVSAEEFHRRHMRASANVDRLFRAAQVGFLGAQAAALGVLVVDDLGEDSQAARWQEALRLVDPGSVQVSADE